MYVMYVFQFPVNIVALTGYQCGTRKYFYKTFRSLILLTSALLFVRPPVPFSAVERRTATVHGVRSEVNY